MLRHLLLALWFFRLRNLRRARNSNPVTRRAVRGQHRSQQVVTDLLRPKARDDATPGRRQQIYLQLRVSSSDHSTKGATQATWWPLSTTAPLTCLLRESNTRWKHRDGWREKLRHESVGGTMRLACDICESKDCLLLDTIMFHWRTPNKKMHSKPLVACPWEWNA